MSRRHFGTRKIMKRLAGCGMMDATLRGVYAPLGTAMLAIPTNAAWQEVPE